MKTLIRIALLLLSIVSVRGDGIPFEGNRVARYATTVIDMTSDQMAALDQRKDTPNQPAIVWIALTEMQRKRVLDEAGFAPREIEVWPLAQAQQTCTCELLNIAVRFESGRVEVPHFLLGVDHADRFRTRDDRVAGKTKPNEQRLPTPASVTPAAGAPVAPPTGAGHR